jgi:hypothetical protein
LLGLLLPFCIKVETLPESCYSCRIVIIRKLRNMGVMDMTIRAVFMKAFIALFLAAIVGLAYGVENTDTSSPGGTESGYGPGGYGPGGIGPGGAGPGGAGPTGNGTGGAGPGGVGPTGNGTGGAGPSGSVVLYEDINYEGRSMVYGGSAPWVGDDFNDIASSLKVPSGYCVILYEHINYGGKSKQFCQNTPSVGDDFNDIVSSFKVLPQTSEAGTPSSSGSGPSGAGPAGTGTGGAGTSGTGTGGTGPGGAGPSDEGPSGAAPSGTGTSASESAVETKYWETWGESTQFGGWLDEGDSQLVGDFMDLGHDQVLFINRQSEVGAGRMMIVDFSDGKPPKVKYWETWGESTQFGGWLDEGDSQLVGDFMGLGHDQVLFINGQSEVGAGKMMIVDFSKASP